MAAEQLDLEAALKSASQRNDLLPPRHEDKVTGEVGKRFLEGLARDVARGTYEPDRAVRVQVPKPGLTTRPASLLTLSDRVLYEALTAALRPRIEKYLVSDRVAFWPRAHPVPKRWVEFEQAPLAYGKPYIAVLDISGFYESVVHDVLTAIALEATGRREVVEALHEFLGRCMGVPRGLPQGVVPSDTLATLYLAPLDKAMLQYGLDYVRHGDDIRIAVEDYAAGRAVIAFAEDEVRSLSLMLNSSKCRVLKVETYRQRLEQHAATETELRKRIETIKLDRMQEGDPALLADIAASIGVWGWEEISDAFEDDVEGLVRFVAEWEASVGPYESLDVQEAIEVLRPRITADDEEVAEALFRDAIAHHPAHKDQAQRWSKERFHVALADSLTSLAARDNGAAISECGRLLKLYPDETEVVVQYLSALLPHQTREVLAQLEEFLHSPGFKHAWQIAWVYRTLAAVADEVSDASIERARRDAEDEDAEWIQRVEAAQLLAARGVLDRNTLLRLYRRGPVQFRPDLVACAVVLARLGQEWASPFVDGCRGDRVIDVVIEHLKAKE